MRSAGVQIFALVLLAPAAFGDNPPGHLELRAGGLRGVVSDNRAFGERHKAGYSGLAELHRGEGTESFFVPDYAGLNFEHVFSGDAATYAWDIFEPRRTPMDLIRVSDAVVELQQERTAHWPLRSVIRYELSGDGAVDFQLRFTPTADAWGKHRTIGVFFASYINAPKDLAIQFLGRSRPGKGDPTPRWVRHLPVEHGKDACHRPAGSDWDPPLDPGFPITLASGLSDLEFIEPFFFGVVRGQALLFLFEPPGNGAELRFAQSPSGGGRGNPAWDFLLLQRRWEVGKEFGLRGRLAVRDFQGREEVLRTYAAWSGREVATPGLPAEAVGTFAPEWRDLDWVQGGPLRLWDLQGKTVLVRWWTADGCPFCAASAPALRKLAADFRERGLVVVGLYHNKVAAPLRKPDVAAAAKLLGFEFPVAIDPESQNLRRWWLDAARREFTSVSFVIDPTGVVRFVHPGGALTLEEDERFPEARRDYAALRKAVEDVLEGLHGAARTSP
jgi:peroxiredoxin